MHECETGTYQNRSVLGPAARGSRGWGQAARNAPHVVRGASRQRGPCGFSSSALKGRLRRYRRVCETIFQKMVIFAIASSVQQQVQIAGTFHGAEGDMRPQEAVGGRP